MCTMRVRTEVSFLGVGEVFYDEVEVLDEEEVNGSKINLLFLTVFLNKGSCFSISLVRIYLHSLAGGPSNTHMISDPFCSLLQKHIMYFVCCSCWKFGFHLVVLLDAASCVKIANGSKLLDEWDKVEKIVYLLEFPFISLDPRESNLQPLYHLLYRKLGASPC